MPELLQIIQRIADTLDRLAANAGDLPEGLDADAAAKFVGVSRSAFLDYVARGLAPDGVLIGDGRARRWLRSELAAWMKAGCPAALKWQSMRRRAG